MSREIKFRAWSKGNKALFYSENQEQGMLDIWLRNPDVYDLMQFTGLKDKNGVEIYEGDLVKNDSYKILTYPLIVRYYEPLCQFVLMKYKDSLWEFVPISDIGNVKKLEVIGNIYENQELLKEQ